MPGRLVAVLASLAAPPACAACSRPVPAGADICADCRAALPWLRGPRCPRCALPSPCARSGGGARRCPAAGSAVDAAWSPMAHAGPARALVHALKFRGALGLAGMMAAQVAANAPPGLLAPGCVLVPVPAHPLRLRPRGVDHAGTLATALAARTGLPVVRCLVRRGAPARQLGAARDERLAGGRLAIRVRGAAPADAVLVDDVHTTGATLDACARALRQAGASRVRAVAYARALAGNPVPLR